MKNVLKKLALLAIPVVLYLAFFITFEPNNYFGLYAPQPGGGSTAPIARIRAFTENPGSRLILGDSRLAHFDLSVAQAASGKQWQNLAFGGASLRETLDLAEFALETTPDIEEILFGVSFYTFNSSYDTDRMSALESTLRNPLAYIFNLEYNVNALTGFSNWAAWLRRRAAGETSFTWAESKLEHETGDWAYPADYTSPSTGEVYPVHTKLARYPATIYPVCENWRVNEEQLARLCDFAALCQARGIALTLVLPPMSDNVLEEVCRPLGIDTAMQPVLQTLNACGARVLDYEWAARPDFDDDRQFFDGFHLDTSYGLPQFTEQLFSELR